MQRTMATTAFELPGYTIVESLGMVRGVTVRSRNVISTWFGSLSALFGGKIGTFVTLCEDAREEAFTELLAHADVLGANAVIGVRYDANEIMRGITEVLAYGTAVRVERKS